jgi:hypothetical protein
MLDRAFALVTTLWFWFAQAAGVLLVAGGISYGVLHFFSVNGPVLVVVEGPEKVTPTVPYRGTMSYRISTERRASCPGRAITTFSFQGGGPPVRVTYSRPIVSTEIKRTDDATVYVQLPAAVFPGKWLYRQVIDSTCPTFSQQDVLVEIPIEVKNVDGTSQLPRG